MRLPSPRRSNDKRIAGVAGGLAATVGVNPTIVRVAFVALAVPGGAGMLMYLAAWLLMYPPDPWTELADGGPPPGMGGTGRRPAVGSMAQRPTSLVAGGGVLFVAGIVVGLATFDGFDVVPTVVTVLLFSGIVLLNRRSDAASAQLAQSAVRPLPQPPLPEPAPQQPQQPPPPSRLSERTAVPSMTTPPPVSSPPPPDPPRPAASLPPPVQTAPAQDTTNLQDTAQLQDPAPRAHWAVTRTVEETTLAPASRPDDGPPLASITVAALAFLLGATLVTDTVFGASVSAVAVAGLATAMVGVAVSISAFTGRTLRLIPIALVSLVILAAAPGIDFARESGAGSSTITVTSVDNLRPEYELGVGSLDLHLERLQITEDTMLQARVDVGVLEITVPSNVAVEVRATTKAGYLYLLDRERGGFDVSFTRIPGGTTTDDGPRLIIQAENTIGEIYVYRGPDIAQSGIVSD